MTYFKKFSRATTGLLTYIFINEFKMFNKQIWVYQPTDFFENEQICMEREGCDLFYIEKGKRFGLDEWWRDFAPVHGLLDLDCVIDVTDFDL